MPSWWTANVAWEAVPGAGYGTNKRNFADGTIIFGKYT
jgi:hypothetical protein